MEFQIFSRYKRPLVSGSSFKKPSLTSQEFKDECNINKILYKYASQAKLLGLPLSEVLPKLDSNAFRDVSNSETFQQSMNRIVQMEELYRSLPSDVRRKYGDTVEGFIGALGNPSEYEYLADHGVLDHGQVKEFMSYVKPAENAPVKSANSSGQEPTKTGESVVPNNGEKKND